MGYNGSAKINFHINRIKDLDTDTYRVLIESDDLDREEELALEIEGRSYYQEGRLYGPPENCYPSEGETEILSISWKGKPFPWELTENEREQAEEMISNAVQEDEGPDPDEYYDDDRDYDDG